MKEYKVTVFKHLLKNNQIAKKGDVVKENQLVNPEESEKGGFVKEVKTSKKGTSKKEDDKK